MIRGNIRQINNFAKKAHELIPSDVKTKEFYQEIKAINDRVTAPAKQEESTPEQKGPSEAESKGLKRVIVTDPEERKQQET